MSAPVEFAVWAPLPERVRVQVDGAVHDMRRDEGGWWRAEVEAGPEADYGFLLDDDDVPRPDPRSRRQPDGRARAVPPVRPGRPRLGRRRLDRPPAGRWRRLRDARRHVHPRGHASTPPIGRLDHLVDLGVDFVELLPVNAFNGTHNWGYDGVLWYAVQETYGGPAGYQRFVDACHQRGLGVIQDVVYNHLGPSGNYLPSSSRSSPRAAPTPGATRSTCPGPTPTRCAATSSTTP